MATHTHTHTHNTHTHTHNTHNTHTHTTHTQHTHNTHTHKTHTHNTHNTHTHTTHTQHTHIMHTHMYTRTHTYKHVHPYTHKYATLATYCIKILISNYNYYAAIIITNGPQDTTVCMNAIAECDCGFSGANPDHVFPDWIIIYRSDTGSVISNFTVDSTDIVHRPKNGLQWSPDLTSGDNNAPNSKLLVGPVNKTHNQSSYQCIFQTYSDVISSSVGTMTVVGKQKKTATNMCIAMQLFSCIRCTISYDQCG